MAAALLQSEDGFQFLIGNLVTVTPLILSQPPFFVKVSNGQFYLNFYRQFWA